MRLHKYASGLRPGPSLVPLACSFLAPICLLGSSLQTATAERVTDPIATRAAELIRKKTQNKPERRVLVWNCAEPNGDERAFGAFFAEQFSESLRAALGGTWQVTHPKQLDPADRFATAMGALHKKFDLLVQGTCEHKRREVRIRLEIRVTGTGRRLGVIKESLAATPEMIALLDQRPSPPICESCPPPKSDCTPGTTKAAGIVLLRMMINPEGKAENITIVKSVGDACLDQRAIEAVRVWRFTPARGPGGMPVAVWTTVEINFRQYGPS